LDLKGMKSSEDIQIGEARLARENSEGKEPPSKMWKFPPWPLGNNRKSLRLGKKIRKWREKGKLVPVELSRIVLASGKKVPARETRAARNLQYSFDQKRALQKETCMDRGRTCGKSVPRARR